MSLKDKRFMNSQICDILELERHQELFVALGYHKNEIQVLDKKDFSQRALLQGHTNRVLDISFSSCFKYLVSASPDKSI